MAEEDCILVVNSCFDVFLVMINGDYDNDVYICRLLQTSSRRPESLELV